MTKLPLLVVPVDFAPEMEATVGAAFALAKRNGADVHLLEVVSPRSPSLLDTRAGVRSRDRVTSKSEWSRLQRSIRAAERSGVDVSIAVHRGDATKVIAAYLPFENAALLIIGKHYGTSRRRRNTSIVSQLSRSARAPVLVLPLELGSGKKKELSFCHLVSAVDFTVASAVAVRAVIDLIRRTGARLTLVHALKSAAPHLVLSGFEALEVARNLEAQAAQLAERLLKKVPPKLRIRVDARVTTGQPHRAILAVASEVDADLIVMGVPPRSRLDQVLVGSTLRGVLRHAEVPVLVLPVPAGAHRWWE